MKFFNLERKEYKQYVKKFRNTYIGGRLYNIFETFFTFAMLNLAASFAYEVILNEESNIFSTIIFWIMCISVLISYYIYFKYLKEYIEKVEK